MTVDAGSAVGYLDLDIKGFLSSLKEAQEAAAGEVQKIEKTFSDKLNSIADSCNQWGKTFSVSVTAPLTAAGGVLLKFGIDFQTAMKNVEAITQMTAEELQTLEAGIHDISRATSISSAELANQVKMVAEAGGDMDLMLAQLQHGANLAVASQTDLATTLDMVGSAMKTFGLEAEDTQQVVDSLAMVTTLANTSLSDLSQAYVNVGGIAHQTGLSIDEVNAFLTELANAGMKGGAAGTSLAGVLRNLSAPTEKASQELENLGIALYDNDGASRNMMDIMQELQDVLSEMTDEQKAHSEAVIFDTNSLKAWRMATASGIDTIAELAEELSNAGEEFEGLGVAAGMMEKQTEGLGTSFKEVWNEVQRLGVQFLEIVEGPVKQFLGALTDLLVWFGKLDPSIQTTIIALAALAASVGPVLLVVAKLITALTTVAGALGTIGVTGASVGAAFTTFGGIIAGIVGGALAIFKAALITVGAVLAGISAPVWIVIGVIAALGVAIWYFWDEIKEVCQGIGILWGEFTTWFMDSMSALGTWLAETWTAIWEGIKSFFSGVVQWFVSSVQQMFTKIQEVVTKVIEVGNNIVQQAMDIGRRIVEGVWQGIQNAASWFYNKIQGFFSGMVDGVMRTLGIRSPSKVFADQIGRWIPAGIAEGFEDAMPQALKEMQKCLDAGMGMLAANDVELAYNFAPSGRGGGQRQTETGGGGSWDTGTAGGGNTYHFHSPEPISEAVARREVEELNRRLAFGF